MASIFYNEGFENSGSIPSGWNFLNGGVDWSIDSADPAFDDYCLRLDLPSSNSATDNTYCYSDLITVTGGDVVRVSGYMKTGSVTTDSTKFKAEIMVSGTGISETLGEGFVTTNGYTYFEKDFYIPVSTSSIRLYLRGYGSSGTVRFDQIILESNPVLPTAIGMDMYSYWRLDDFADEGPESMDLISIGTGSDPVAGDGCREGCYVFDNINNGPQALYPGAIDVLSSEALSMTAWINPSVLQSGFSTTSPHTIGRFYLSTSGSSILDFRIRDSKLEVYYTNPSSNNLSSLTVPTDQWSFVGMTQSATELTLYLNDQKQSFTVSGGQAYDRFVLGSTSGSSSRGLNGSVDEVRLYRRQLTDDDMLDIYAYTDIETGFEGFWRLDGGFDDSSPQDNDLISVGTGSDPVSYSYGYINGCYEFDNINYGPQALSSSDITVDANDFVTITAWISPSILQSGFTSTSPHTIARLYHSTIGSSILDFRIRDSKLDVYYTNPVANNLTSFQIPVDQWSFVAVVQKDTVLEVHLNDQFQTFTVSGGQAYDRLILGAASSSSSRGLNGLIDEVRFYKRALKSDDISEIYEKN
ncbi:MAG: LamG-like jellyroll fold domain-containing protein [Sedimentisphaeraceae bacterium JB056]